MTCLDHDRLHALLDGALAPDDARSAERHLVECAACQMARDAVARLRDDATAILSLGRVTPRRMPPFAVLAARAAAQRTVAAAVGEPDVAANVRELAPVSTGANWRRIAPMAAAACVGLVVFSATRQSGMESATAEATIAVAEPPRDDLARAEAAPSRRSETRATRLTSERPPDPREPLFLPVRVSFGAGAATVPSPGLASPMHEAAAVRPADAPRITAPEATVPVRRATEPAVAIVPLDAGASAGTVATDEHWADHATDETDDDALPAQASSRADESAASMGAPAPARSLRAGPVLKSAAIPTPSAGDSIRARIRRSLQRPALARTASLP